MNTLIKFFMVIVAVCAVWAALAALTELWTRIWHEEDAKKLGRDYDNRWGDK